MSIFKKFRSVRRSVQKLKNESAENLDWRQKLRIYWPVFDALLELIKTFTPDKVDKVLLNLQLGVSDVVTDGDEVKQTAFFAGFRLYWPPVATLLNFLMVITGPKGDKVILEILALGDDLADKGQSAINKKAAGSELAAAEFSRPGLYGSEDLQRTRFSGLLDEENEG